LLVRHTNHQDGIPRLLRGSTARFEVALSIFVGSQTPDFSVFPLQQSVPFAPVFGALDSSGFQIALTNRNNALGRNGDL
jgi:hypothetical protein